MRWVIAAIVAMLAMEVRGQTTAPVPAETVAKLVAQLGGDDWAARQKAQEALVELGEDALPRIKEQLAGATDEEVRTRLEAAVRQIDADIKDGPTRITLHVKNAPLTDVLIEISKQAGVRMGFEGQPPNPMPTLTLDVDRQPFWLVMKEIAAKTGVGPGAISHPRGIIGLQQGSNFARLPGYNRGCLYVMASSISRTDDNAPANPQNASRSLYLEMAIWVDPKIKVASSGFSLDIQEASDEKGHVLLDGIGGGGRRRVASYPVDLGAGYRRVVVSQLNYVPEIGKKIARFKGSASFLIQTKSEQWEVADILNAKNVSEEFSSGKYTIRQVQKTGEDGYVVNILTESPANRPQGAIDGCSTMVETMKLVDSSGGIYWTKGGFNISSDSRKGNYRCLFRRNVDGLHLVGEQSSAGEPVKLVCDVPLEVKEVSVPVELRDLALP